MGSVASVVTSISGIVGAVVGVATGGAGAAVFLATYGAGTGAAVTSAIEGGHAAPQAKTNHEEHGKLVKQGYSVKFGNAATIDFTQVLKRKLDVHMVMGLNTHFPKPQMHVGIVFSAPAAQIKTSFRSSRWQRSIAHRLSSDLHLDVADNLDDFSEAIKTPVDANRFAYLSVGSCTAERMNVVSKCIDSDLKRSLKIKINDCEMGQFTNCTVFVIRVLKALDLHINGVQIAKKARAMGRDDLDLNILAAAWQHNWNKVN